MLSKIKKRLHQLRIDTRGSEAVEMVYAASVLAIFIIVALMCMTYVMEINMVNYAVKKVVREIEVTGIVNEADMQYDFDRYLGPSSQIIDRKIEISNVTTRGGKVQLLNTFRVTGSVTYRIQFLNPGNFEGFVIDMPIKSSVTGMSEVYFRY